MNWLKFAALTGLTVLASLFLVVQFGNFRVRELEQRVDQLQQERVRLIDYARRLSESRRVAQVNILGQRADEQGRTVTSLRWQEVGERGLAGQPQMRDVIGAQVYFEGMVLKFAPVHVGEGDPQRGASLALFRRIFGDAQAAESVPDLEAAARPPPSADPAARAFQERLWGLFWEFAEKPALAEQYGVRVAQIEAPAVRSSLFATGQIWEVTLDAAGGLNVLKVNDRAMP
jgi:hypothetical protein